jgi:hypothetical protein
VSVGVGVSVGEGVAVGVLVSVGEGAGSLVRVGGSGRKGVLDAREADNCETAVGSQDRKLESHRYRTDTTLNTLSANIKNIMAFFCPDLMGSPIEWLG